MVISIAVSLQKLPSVAAPFSKVSMPKPIAPERDDDGPEDAPPAAMQLAA